MAFPESHVLIKPDQVLQYFGGGDSTLGAPRPRKTTSNTSNTSDTSDTRDLLIGRAVRWLDFHGWLLVGWREKTN